MHATRDARGLPREAVDTVASLWKKADETPEMQALREAAVALGAESEWRAVAEYVVSELPDTSAGFRGAVVDVIYLAYWRSHRGAEQDPSLADGWPTRLENAWRQGLVEGSHSGVGRPAEVLCLHGERRGRCGYIACSHHPLGGIDLYGEM
jgi:hypothetical protein